MIKDAIEDAASLERTESSIDLYLDGWRCLEERKGGVMKRYKIGYGTDEWGMNRRMCLIQDANGEAVRFVDAAKKIYELEQKLAEAEAKIPKWIPVEERLTKPGANILAIDNSGDMGVCTFVNAKFIGECFGFEAYLNDGGWDCSASKVIGEYVTHWMPLPDAPETERKGK